MTLVRWMPRRDIMSVQQEINNVFNSLFGNTRTADADDFETSWAPRLDVSEDKDHYNVKVDLPGMKREDVKITLRENILNVRGERAEDAKREGESFHILERRFGKFSRSLTLPTNVDASNIAARMADGILTIAIPKAEESKPREISIG